MEGRLVTQLSELKKSSGSVSDPDEVDEFLQNHIRKRQTNTNGNGGDVCSGHESFFS